MHQIAAISVLILLLETVKTEPIVKTSSGEIRGISLNVLGKKINAFLGIPFALPPVGKLRFAKPVPINAWQGVYKATKKSPSCPQFSPEFRLEWIPSDNINEDCLYLNVWVPSDPKEDKATIIWIHGGGFLQGSSVLDLYDGQVLASQGNVIVASMNYRLGSFGFLYADTDDAPGNAGLHDQLLAIRWIKDNLRSFGGDPSSITLTGQSAGAISIGFHLVSPLSNGLMNRVIMQSSSAYNRMYALPPKISKIVTAVLARKMGCKSNLMKPTKVLNCLRKKSAEDIYKEEIKMANETFIGFFPRYGDDFLPYNPMDMMEDNSFHPVDMLIGNNADEGSIFVALRNWTLFFRDRPVTTEAKAKYYIKDILRYNFDVSNEVVIKKYVGSVSDKNSDSLLKASCRAVGDFLFTCPNIFTSEKYSTNNTVYYYYFTHRSSQPWVMVREWMGVHHGQEVPFLFGIPLTKKDKYLKEEIEFSLNIMDAWSSFAKTGVPHYAPLAGEWPKVSSHNSSYVELNPYRVAIGNNLYKNECDFWRSHLL